jgi:phospholipid-translocating ATPase
MLMSVAEKADEAEFEVGAHSFGLVIDGDSLHTILDDKSASLEFLKCALRCRSVVCCRVSPKQKALVVNLVKRNLNAMCLSIGDGANDVGMIQEANVGVGLAGAEGLQAAMSSDYVIYQFRFLVKLLLVHGRWSYVRCANMVLNFFYKSFVWVIAQFWFQIYNGYVFKMVKVDFGLGGRRSCCTITRLFCSSISSLPVYPCW